MIHVSAVGHGRRYEEYGVLSRVSGRIRTIGSHRGEEPSAPSASPTSGLSGLARKGEQGAVSRWLIAGFVLLLGALALAVLATGEGTLPSDIAIARAVQWPASGTIDTAARVLSLIGADIPSTLVLALIGVALLILAGRRDLALFLGVAAALRAIGPVLKVLIASPRPTVDAVVIVAKADGLGFPSGHAMGAALFYGALAIIAPQVVANRVVARSIQIAAMTLMVLIAISRVRLGVHWPSDVAGGLLFGLAIVCFWQAAFLQWRKARLKT